MITTYQDLKAPKTMPHTTKHSQIPTKLNAESSGNLGGTLGSMDIKRTLLNLKEQKTQMSLQEASIRATRPQKFKHPNRIDHLPKVFITDEKSHRDFQSIGMNKLNTQSGIGINLAYDGSKQGVKL